MSLAFYSEFFATAPFVEQTKEKSCQQRLLCTSYLRTPRDSMRFLIDDNSRRIYLVLLMLSLCTSFPTFQLHILNPMNIGPHSMEDFDNSLLVGKSTMKNQNLNWNLQIRGNKTAKQSGNHCEEHLEVKKNSTMKQRSSYERLKGSWRTFERRLRTAVTFKKSLTMDYKINGDPMHRKATRDDDRNLYEMMESIEDDEELKEDDEEYVFEKLITEIIHESKFANLETKSNTSNEQNENNYCQNFQSFEKTDDPHAFSTTEGSSGPEVPVHRPSKSGSWGIFERPADISKAYGGGRRITRGEMKHMDEIFKLKAAEGTEKKRSEMRRFQSMEFENEMTLKNALSSYRSYMMFGDRNRALTVLEDIVRSNLVRLSEDLGSEVYLEYGMVLETLERGEEAKKVYCQLISKSTSAEIRRNAMQLLQGLEITLKLRNQVPIVSKPVIDMEAMQTMSRILRAGLIDEWNSYRLQELPRTRIYEKTEDDLYKLETTQDTYRLLLMSASSSLFLEKVPPAVIRRAVRNMFLLSNEEKIELMKQNMPSLLDDTNNRKECMNMEMREAEKLAMSPPINFALSGTDRIRSEPSCFAHSVSLFSDIMKEGSNKKHFISAAKVFEKQLNGSWELMFSINDKSSGQIKKKDLGEVRRYIYFSPSSVNLSSICCNNKAIESFPSMWGLSVSKIIAAIEWYQKRSEITFIFDDRRGMQRSPAPWQDRSQSQHTLQIVWVDREIMITNEINQAISEPDMFTMWRRIKSTKQEGF